AVAIRHTLRSGHGVRLTLEPLCTWRDAHGERYSNNGLRVEQTADGVLVENSYRIAGPGFEFAPEWYFGAFHREEAARGLNATEDWLRAGRFAQVLQVGDTLDILAWSGDPVTTPPPAGEIIEGARERARRLTASAPDATAGSLALAADTFIVEGGGGVDVVA